MLRVFNVLFSIRKGLGPEWLDKYIVVAFDDLPEDTSEWDVRQMARNEAELRLYNSDDYPVYGKNWTFKEVYDG